jgi:polysaccharide deacetylase 2 family uncharacterized protein YibQ
MGSSFTADHELMTVVFKELKLRGLFFLDSLTTHHSKGEIIAKEVGLPFLKRHIFIDNYDNIVEIRKQLTKIEKLSMIKGFAIAICHPRRSTLKALKPWLLSLKRRGFQLVSLSNILSKTKK